MSENTVNFSPENSGIPVVTFDKIPSTKVKENGANQFSVLSHFDKRWYICIMFFLVCLFFQ